MNKLDDNYGRAAIIENGSPLFTGGTSSGESQIRRYLLENDLLEAIVQMPTDLFYNTGISTYIWILSKNKRPERRGKIQLIDASGICHKLRKPLGNKKNEFSPEDRAQISRLYADFKAMQRSYSITEESIENMLQKGSLNSLWDEAKVAEYEEQGTAISAKDQKKYDEYLKTKPLYESILEKLNSSVSEKKWMSPKEFTPVLEGILGSLEVDKKVFDKLMDGLSVMDKNAEIQKDKKGNIIYDKESKDTEIVKFDEDIDDYMAREVLPHVSDAKWFWEENLSAKKPVIKIGAKIPFTRYFYKYQQPTPSEELANKFIELEKSVSSRIDSLFGGK